MTTREKLELLVTELRDTEPADLNDRMSQLIEIGQIVQGIWPSVDFVDILLPETDADADQQIDDLITLLLQLRGDDLPPYDFDRHVLDSTAADAEAEA